jgi:hypothetical protein|tara:strand:+ start:533 stop:1180 length:648 start_codon:yes stop_codon:yes gene_type:complete
MNQTQIYIKPKMMKELNVPLFETLPGLARYEIYNYIEKEMNVVRNIHKIPLLFQQFENGYFQGYIDMEEIVDIYNMRFPEDEIYTIFSSEDVYQRYIYELGSAKKKYKVYSEETKNKFACLRETPLENYFRFRHNKDVEVELSELFGARQIKPFWMKSRIYPKAEEETNTFLKKMVAMINEKVEDTREYEKVYNLIFDYELLNEKIVAELERIER